MAVQITGRLLFPDGIVRFGAGLFPPEFGSLTSDEPLVEMSFMFIENPDAPAAFDFGTLTEGEPQ